MKKVYCCALKIAIIAFIVIVASLIAFNKLMFIGGDTQALDLLRGLFVMFDIMTISIVAAILIRES